MTPLEVYTSELPVLFTFTTINIRTYLCLKCIPTVDVKVFASYTVEQVKPQCADLYKKGGRICDRCHKPLFDTAFLTTEFLS